MSSQVFTLDDLCSPLQRAQLNRMHARAGYGWKGHQHMPRFVPHLRLLKCRSMLDYGCGKGYMRAAMAVTDRDIIVDLFDPGHPDHHALPTEVDYVTSVSCLEGVEPDKLDNVLKHIFGLARKGAYFAICVRLGKKNDLPDGRNEHLSVHPPKWWTDKLIDDIGWSITQVDVEDPKFVKVWLEK